MADFSFRCPQCNLDYNLGAEFAGKKLRCVKCAAIFRPPAGIVTNAATPPAPVAKAPPSRRPKLTSEVAHSEVSSSAAKTGRIKSPAKASADPDTKGKKASKPARPASKARWILPSLASLIALTYLGATGLVFYQTVVVHTKPFNATMGQTTRNDFTKLRDEKRRGEPTTPAIPMPPRDLAADSKNEREREEHRKLRSQAEQKMMASLATSESALANVGASLATLDIGNFVSTSLFVFSPTEPLMASVGYSGPVYLWDLNTGEIRTKLSKHTKGVRALAFSPDGKILAAAGEEQVVDLWDVATGNVTRTLVGHPGTIRSLAFTSDGKTIAAGGDLGGDGKASAVQVWDVASGERKKEPSVEQDSISTLAFRPYSSILLTLEGHRTGLHFQDVVSGKEYKCPFEQPKSRPERLAFSPDGKQLALGSARWGEKEHYVSIYDLERGTLTALPEVKATPTDLSWSPDSQVLAYVAENGLTLWDNKAKKILRRIEKVHEDGNSEKVVFTPGGALVGTVGSGGVKLWDFRDLLEPKDVVISDELKKIGKVTRQGKGLRIEVNRDVTDEQLAAVAKAPVAGIEMTWSGNLTDAGLGHFKGLKDLRLLNLSSCFKLTDAGLAHISGLTGLVSLNLAGTKVTAAGLGNLKGMTQLQVLHLPPMKLDAAAMENLKSMTGLRDLELGNCQIDDAAAKYLQGMTRLTRLNLSGNQELTDASADVFTGMTRLTNLSLRDTKVGNKTMANLSGKSMLTFLDIGGTQVSDAGFPFIAEFTNLKMLNCAGLKNLTGTGLKFLKPLTQVTDLDLTGTGVHDEGLVGIKDLKQLTVLALPEGITDVGFVHLGGLTELRTLHVRNLAGLTGPGLAHLANLKHITELNLYNTGVKDEGLKNLVGQDHVTSLSLPDQIGDAGLVHVGQMTTLTILNLNNTKITDAGLAHLKNLHKLSNVNLDSTEITDAGVGKLDLSSINWLYLSRTGVTDKVIPFLKKLPKDHFTYVYVNETNLTEQALADLKSELPKVSTYYSPVVKKARTADLDAVREIAEVQGTEENVYIRMIPTAKDEDLAKIAKVKFIGTLNLSSMQNLSDAGLAHLKGLSTLNNLELYNAKKITDAGLASLAGLTTMKSLHLAGTNVRGAGLAHLKGLTQLENLYLGSTGVTDADLAPLATLVGLKNLQLNDCKIKGTGLAQLKTLKALEQIILDRNPELTDDGLANLAALPALKNLNCNGTAVGDNGLARLKNAKQLEQLGLVGTKLTDAGLAHLSGLEKLQLLLIEGNPGIKGPGLKALEPLKMLSALNLRDTGVNDAGLLGVKGLTQLRYLGLPDGITDAGLAHLSGLTMIEAIEFGDSPGITGSGLKHLEPLKQLTGLNLNMTGVKDAGLEGIKGLTQLTYLALPDGITDAGLAHLAGLTKLANLDFANSPGITGPGLKHLAKLGEFKNLNLATTGVTDAGLANIAGMTNLVTINLPPGIGDAGLAHLKPLTKLQFIGLVKTKVTDTGLKQLGEMKTLVSLQLSQTGIGDKGLGHLKGLTNLQMLTLDGTKVTKEGVAALRKDLPKTRIFAGE